MTSKRSDRVRKLWCRRVPVSVYESTSCLFQGQTLRWPDRERPERGSRSTGHGDFPGLRSRVYNRFSSNATRGGSLNHKGLSQCLLIHRILVLVPVTRVFETRLKVDVHLERKHFYHSIRQNPPSAYTSVSPITYWTVSVVSIIRKKFVL